MAIFRTNSLKTDSENPGQPGQGSVDRAIDTASALAENARNAAASVAHKAEGAALVIGRQAQDATATVGGGLKSLGHRISEHAAAGGVVGAASSAMAKPLESTGNYLQQDGLRHIAEDMTNLIRRHPIPALLVGIGLGFLIARAAPSRSKPR